MSIKNTDVTTKLTKSARSDLWFYPGEELIKGEMRVTLMGTGWGNVVTPSQKGPSIFVELGNDAEDSFVFDVGPGCILNYNAMDVPMSRMNRVFLSHLHMDHCSDLPFIYSFGPNLGDRYSPLNIYGPSGPVWPEGENEQKGKILGTKNLVSGMELFTQWHTTSFKTMTYGSDSSYEIKSSGEPDTETDSNHNVFEFDYRACNGLVFERDSESHGHIKITSFPALHIIDGAVSYRLEWTPTGKDKPIVLVYSGDTLPNEFMLEYGRDADLLIHETAPSISSVVNGANVDEEKAEDIVSNSHTPAEFLGYIFSKTRPKLGITTHTPMDPRSVDAMINDVRKNWPKPDDSQHNNYQIGADFMVFNTNGDDVLSTRMGVPIDRAWPTRIADDPDPSVQPPLADNLPELRKAEAEAYDMDKYCEIMEEDGITPTESTVIFDHQIDETP